MPAAHHSYNIGFISTRFAGTDGVSLETAKWADVLEAMGHRCFYFSGLSDRPEAQAMVVEEAFYRHPEIKARHDIFFQSELRTPDDTRWLHHWRDYFRLHLYRFITEFKLDILIPQNVLAIPLNIPLGVALTELIAETGIPVIAHHHDFAWERKRFLVNSVWDYINMAFPPTGLASIQHVVINSQARYQLARRRGVGSVLIANVMDFARPMPQPDEFSADVRQTLGLDPDELFILQPTRVVQRKGIEYAIELVSRLKRKARLVISHAAGDEGDDYERRVRQYAQLLDVPALFVSEIFDYERGWTADGRKIYNLWDVYPHADLVTYPSVVEGFGNAFLEAVYFRKPIVVNNYSVYATDIKPKGFQAIEFDEYITEDTVAQTLHVLDNPEVAQQMCDHNYDLAAHHFSYEMLSAKLRVALANAFGINEF
jgi:mannosylglucosylglycerate synthase